MPMMTSWLFHFAFIKKIKAFEIYAWAIPIYCTSPDIPSDIQCFSIKDRLTALLAVAHFYSPLSSTTSTHYSILFFPQFLSHQCFQQIIHPFPLNTPPSHPSLFSFSVSFSLFHVPSYDYVTSGRLPIHCTPQLEGSPPHTQTSDGLLSFSWRLCMLPSANQKAPERQGERVSMCAGLAVGACPWVWLWYQSW